MKLRIYVFIVTHAINPECVNGYVKQEPVGKNIPAQMEINTSNDTSMYWTTYCMSSLAPYI